MKLKLVPIILSGLVGISSFATANTGTINFNGSLNANTCNVSVTGGGSSSVDLPGVSVDLLSVSGQTAGLSKFSIELSGCSGSLNTASAYFEQGSDVNSDGRLINRGDATDVEIQLLDGVNLMAINAGNSNQITNTTYIPLASGSALLPYAAQYYATGASSAGTVIASVTYSIQYK